MISKVRFRLTSPKKLRGFQFKTSYIYIFTNVLYTILTATFSLFSTKYPLPSAFLTCSLSHLNPLTLLYQCPCFLLQSKAKTRSLHTAREKAPLKTSELEGTTSVEQTFCILVSKNCLKASNIICKQTWKSFMWCDLILIRQTPSSFIKSLVSCFPSSQHFKKDLNGFI